MTILPFSSQFHDRGFAVFAGFTHCGVRHVLHAMAAVVRRGVGTGAWIGHGVGQGAARLEMPAVLWVSAGPSKQEDNI